MRPLIVIGSGPAAWTAAIYAARARLDPVVVTGSISAGGDLMTTTEVENFPGFPAGIAGPELMAAMREQAERFGAVPVEDDAVRLELDGDVKRAHLASGEVLEASVLVLATGSAYRRLGLADEDRLSGLGVSWCATCDGAFFRDRRVAVIGGGDSALEEATFLTRFADAVHLVHRRDRLRASRAMQDRATADPKVRFEWSREVVGILGEERVEGIVLRDPETGSTTALDVDGVFVAIGSDPRTELVAGQLELTAEGTIAVEGRSSRTSVPGVFAAGDVVDPVYRQAVTAAASGATAAIDAEHYLAARVAAAAVAASA